MRGGRDSPHPRRCHVADIARAAARALHAKGLLLQSADGTQLLAARKRPQRHVDLRGTGQTFTVVGLTRLSWLCG